MHIFRTFVVIALWSCLVPVGSAQPEPMRGSPQDLIQIYGHLSGKTILRPAGLPRLPEMLLEKYADSATSDKSEMIRRIEAGFVEAKIDVIRDGELFVWLVPAGLSNSPAMKQLAQIPRPADRATAANIAESLVPSGMVDLLNAPLEQVLNVYSELRQRNILRPANLPSPQITFKTQNALTKDEVIYAMSVVLLFNGIAVVEDGDKFIQVVPAQTVARVQTGAPKPEANEAMVDPATVPKLRRIFMRTVRGADQSPTPPPIADGLLAFYAQLVNRKPIPNQQLGGIPVDFAVLTPLSKSELLYAIETTLALNGLVIVNEEGDSVRLNRRTVK
jgi:hypothetical protein